MYKNNFSRKIFWFISCSLYCDVMMPHFLLTDENREDKWDCLSLSLQSFLYQHSTLRSMRSVRVLGILCCPNELRLSKRSPKGLPFWNTFKWKFLWYSFLSSSPFPTHSLPLVVSPGLTKRWGQILKQISANHPPEFVIIMPKKFYLLSWLAIHM